MRLCNIKSVVSIVGWLDSIISEADALVKMYPFDTVRCRQKQPVGGPQRTFNRVAEAWLTVTRYWLGQSLRAFLTR